jgi:Ca-activated chloride channel family protein
MITVLLITSLCLPAFSRAPQQENLLKIRITSPREGEFVFGLRQITTEHWSVDEAVLVSLKFYIDEEFVGEATGEPWSIRYDFGRGKETRRIKVVAADSAGRAAEHEIEVKSLTPEDLYIESALVTLDVTVTDERGKLVGGLQAEEFEVYEEGRLVQVCCFSASEQPLRVAVLIDTSESMRGEKIVRAIEAAQQIVRKLGAADQVSVVTFGPTVRTLSGFTGDFPAVLKRIERIKAFIGARTPLKRAMYTTISSFEGLEGRKAMIVLSDGSDTASSEGPEAVLEHAKGGDVKIYTVGLPDPNTDSTFWTEKTEAARLLRETALLTGGTFSLPAGTDELPALLESILRELRSQYSIGYVPPEGGGNEWRQVRVEVKRPGLTARTKGGYYPDRK